MRYSGLTLLMIGALASQVAASVIEARSSLEFIFKRQLGTTACSEECLTFQSALEDCETAQCLCTRSVARSLNSCVNCYYQKGPSQSVLEAVNNLIDTFEETCAGVSGLPPVSVTTDAERAGPTAPA
ncbi:hypothetical protein EST38_g2077 [Candolleomyces aberdarensis]|uniref:Extracellular membrane protein CFEM domain-containing protein n=1 Tax=Candolleomyces aberdarensis TaxID=2316362 RepID=A0A4Q2DU76_9AGAR|nr:hypothetical protein EST38_g2077 [Candolleomyces aberdarensis]